MHFAWQPLTLQPAAIITQHGCLACWFRLLCYRAEKPEGRKLSVGCPPRWKRSSFLWHVTETFSSNPDGVNRRRLSSHSEKHLNSARECTRLVLGRRTSSVHCYNVWEFVPNFMHNWTILLCAPVHVCVYLCNGSARNPCCRHYSEGIAQELDIASCGMFLWSIHSASPAAAHYLRSNNGPGSVYALQGFDVLFVVFANYRINARV